jgi:uncharacterized protein (DUF1778 family)
MASIQLPKSAYTAVQALVRLTPLQFDELIARLEETPPTVDADKFIDSVASRLKELDSATAKLILPELLTMMYSGYRADLKTTELASEISSGALEANSEEFPFTAEQKQLLELRLSNAFGSQGVRITGKAQSVFYDTDKTFVKARILTDLRAIYDEPGDEILAAMVMHSLRIRYYENFEEKDIYLSLDNDDLQGLMEILQRASKKQKGLETLMEKSSIPHVS